MELKCKKMKVELHNYELLIAPLMELKYATCHDV